MMRLPFLAADRLPLGRAALLDALARCDVEQGFVHARAGARELFLFVREGRVWCAGARDGGPGAIAVSAFLDGAAEADEVSLCGTDLPLFLCAAVLFRKPPAAHIPAKLVDADNLMKSLRALGKDAVLAVQNNGAWALAFCRSGEIAALYAAPELTLSQQGSLEDRLMELVYAAPADVSIDLYDEIKLPPAADAGQPLSSLSSLTPAPAEAKRPTLVVILGERVVFRHRIDKLETVVGRGLEADLALDNLSVSRRHALVRVVGERVVVEDLGSENGITFVGERVSSVELDHGESVGVGKYTLAYATHTNSRDEITNPRRHAAMTAADIDTVRLSGGGASIEHRGRKQKVASAVFTIGSSPDAHLRVRGVLVAGVHTVIQIEGEGYRVERIGAVRALRVNGEVTRGKRLADGDIITIAGEDIRFSAGPAPMREPPHAAARL